MDHRLMDVFMLHISRQSHSAVFGAWTAAQAANARDYEAFWTCIQTCLSGVANVSKALFGTDVEIFERRKPIRDALAVADGNILRDRKMRNHFEHFDERLE